MTSTTFIDQNDIVKNRASEYTLRGGTKVGSVIQGGTLALAEFSSSTQMPSFYVIMSTVIDLAKWDAAFYSERLLKRSILEQMWTPARLNDDKMVLIWGRHHGLGWFLGDYRGHKVTEYGGSTGTAMLRLPEDRLTVIVLTNLDFLAGSDPHILARGIADFYLGDL